MATNTLKTRLIMNNKTAAAFAADTSTVWMKGELLIENDTLKMKVGDGINTFGNLGYVNLTPSEVEALISAASHTHSNKAILDAITASFTTELKNKLDGIAAGAEVNVQSDWNVVDTTSDAYIKNKPTSMPASDVSAWAKAPTKPTYTATEVGADPTGSAAGALSSAKTYTDGKISDLINGAPETLDTLKEVADAIKANETVVDALNDAIGTKANASDLTAHTGNATIHVTSENKTQWNSAYTHSTSAHAPSNAERNVVVGIQKNGTDLTPDASRKVNVVVPTKVSELANDSGYKTTDNDTTYTFGVAANSATNGNAKVRLTAGGSGSGSQDVTIKGSGATSVTTDTNGVIIVSSTNTVYTHPKYTAHASGLYKITVDDTGHVSAVAAVEKSDITALGIPGSDTTYGAAGTDLGLVKSGGDVTIENGVITVKDDSHNHTIANVDGLQDALDGKAAVSHGTHVTYATAAPLANGAAAVGTSSKVAREDHVHPLQTSVSGSSGSCTGNAKTATTLQTARNIGLTGQVTATAASFDGSKAVNINVTAINAMGIVVNDGDTLILDGSI